MIFEGYPGGAQAEGIQSGKGERIVGGRTIHYPSDSMAGDYRIQDTTYSIQAYKDVDARMQD